MIHKTPRLVFCIFSGSWTRPTEPIIEALVLTSLRSLQLLNTTSAEYLLDNLIAPHLEEFSHSKYYNTSMEVIRQITFFLRRSACSLRSFSVIFGIFPPCFEGFMSLLQSMPSLNTLSIIMTPTTRYFDTIPEDYDPRNILRLVAKVLSSQSTSLQGFLPNLKILEYAGRLPANLVVNPEFLRLDSESIGDLYSLPPADNAVHGPFHLLKLDLHPATRISKNMISYFSSLMERGVTVRVLSTSEDILQSSIDFYRCNKDSL